MRIGCSGALPLVEDRTSFVSNRRGAKHPIILCIDDDPNVPGAVDRSLRKYKVDVIRAYSGLQGYFLAATELPDVIVTDLRMTQGPGDEMIECLKRNAMTLHIPVVVVSGFDQPEIRRHVAKVGAAAFLAKPLRFDKLFEELERHISLLPWRV